MKNIVFIFVLLFTSLSAKDIYIKVMSVHQANLFSSVYSLNSLGYKSYTTEYGDLHRVYAGPFHDMNEASSALRVIQGNISQDAFISIIPAGNEPEVAIAPLVVTQSKTPNVAQVNEEVGFASVSSVDDEVPLATVSSVDEEVSYEEEEPIETQVTQDNQDEAYNDNYVKDDYYNKDFFIGLSVGTSKLGIDEKDVSGNLILDITLEDTGFTYGLESGYNFNNNFFMTINYQHTDAKDVLFDTIFTTLNYKFDEMLFIYPYVGVLAGYSVMSWENYPISSLSIDDKANSFVGGIQLGSEMPIVSDISMYILYRYWIMDFKTNVNQDTNTKEITHQGEQNINLGVKYSF